MKRRVCRNLAELKRRRLNEKSRYWTPTAPPYNDQQGLYRSLAKIILALGGNRSGKTESSVAKANDYCTGRHPTLSKIRKPPVYGRHCGTTWTDGILNVILKKYQAMVRREDLFGGSWESAWSQSNATLTYCLDGDTTAVGSVLHFKTYEQKVSTFGGDDLDFVIMDEHAPKAYFVENMARLVDRNGWLLLTETPESGITWEDEEIVEKWKRSERGFEVYSFDSRKNPYLSKEGLEQLIRTIGGDEELFKTKIQGLMVALAGRIYKVFSEDLHAVDDFDLGAGHRQIILDPHLGKPHALGWLHWNRQGQCHLYRISEFDSSKGGIPALARHVRIMCSGETIDDWIIDEALGGDPDDQTKNAFGEKPIITQLNEAGLPFLGTNQVSDKDIKAGIEAVRELLLADPATGLPRFRVFRSCYKAIKQFMVYQWKPKTKADETSYRELIRNIEDEFPTIVRYGVMAKPVFRLPAPPGDRRYDPETGEPLG